MKMIRYSLLSLFAFICMWMLSSCEHRPLQEASGASYIRVYLDEQIKNVTCGIYNEEYENPTYFTPASFRAVLASTQTGIVEHEAILRNHGTDEKGDYVDGYIGLRGGEYNLLVYSMGSSVTHINNPDNYYEMFAYTSPVSDRILGFLPVVSGNLDRESIVNQTDHLLVCSPEPLSVHLSGSVDTLRDVQGDYFVAQSIAKSYYLQLRIKGVEWVSSAGAVISGMAGSAKMGSGNRIEGSDSVYVFFSMKYASKQKRDGEDVSSAVLYSTFTTFGKLEGANSILHLNLEFTRTDGTTQYETIDITEMFNTPLVKEKQWILLDKEIVITPPERAGGMGPGVEGWKDIETDVII